MLSRVLTTPFHAKQLLRALQENVAIYERAYGEIRSDFGVTAAVPSDTKTN